MIRRAVCEEPVSSAHCAVVLCAAAMVWPPPAVSAGRLRAIFPKCTYHDVLVCVCLFAPQVAEGGVYQHDTLQYCSTLY